MHDALRVCLPYRVADLERDREGALDGQRAACALEHRGERRPVQVLHDDVRSAIGEVAGEVDLDHVRVAQFPCDFGLPIEALHELAFVRELAVEDLHRHVSLGAALMSAVDLAHGARAGDRAKLDVLADHRAEVRISGFGPRRER